MSKKLVKTAKQQFEERLRELGLLDAWKDQGACGRIGTFVWDNDSIVIFVHEDDDDKYSEFFYPPFEELREDETFCKECLKEFACNSDDRLVASLVRWIVDKGERPLDPEDVYIPANHLMYSESHDFEDIYEEVPDVRIITAKEQWEKDSEGAEIIATQANGSVYKIAVTDGSITFFIHQNKEYFREIYPSFDELRKDVNFVMAYLSHVRVTHDKDVDYALAWIQGGEYNMSKVSLLDIYEVGECIDHLCYHDKEEPVGKPIIKNEFRDEMNALREKMVQHIIQLCEQGMTVNVDSLTKRIALGWEDNSFVYTEDIKDLFVKKAENGEWLFCYTSYSNGRSDEYPFKYLSIETLQMFIEAMQ